MKRLAEFIKTTFIGGMLVVLPLYLSILLMLKLLEVLAAIIAPLTVYLSVRPEFRYLIVLAAAVGLCFLAGLVVRTGPGKWIKNATERRLLERIPGYALIRGLAGRFVGQAENESFAPALVELEESLVPAFVVDRHADGRFTVFVPSVPTPATGALYIMEPAKVHLVDVSFHKALAVISHWGAGSQELIAALKDKQAGLTQPLPAAIDKRIS
jgi:uncharacterized membrane protein